MIWNVEFRFWWISAGVVSLLAAESPACDLPVFRYALERWPASSYRAQVVSRGALDHDAAQACASLVSSNLLPVESFDLNAGVKPDGLSPDLEAAITPATPFLRLQLDHDAGGSAIVWEDRLTARNVALLINSPGRCEIVRRLMAGDAVVWLVLKGADPAQNAAMIATVQRALNKAESELQLPLPEGENGGYTIPLTPSIPFKISFSVLALAYKSPESEFFRSLFSRTLPESTIAGDLPVLAPVFGRGRVLNALAGTSVNEGVIHDLCTYLVGNCSCEVKAQNPGVDLFLPVNWQAALSDSTPVVNVLPALIVPVAETPPYKKGEQTLQRPQKDLLTSTPGGADISPLRALCDFCSSSLLKRRLLLVGLFGLVAVGVGVWVITRKGSRQ